MNLVNPRGCKDKFGYILLFYEWIKMRDTTKKNEEGKKEKLWDYNVTLSLLHIQYLVKKVLKNLQKSTTSNYQYYIFNLQITRGGRWGGYRGSPIYSVFSLFK